MFDPPPHLEMIRGIEPLPQTLIFYSLYIFGHSCMPSPLAPDPIRVRSCACCLFWTNSNSIAVSSIFLYIYLIHYPIRVMSSSIGAINKWIYLLLLKLYCGTREQGIEGRDNWRGSPYHMIIHALQTVLHFISSCLIF